MKKKYVLALDFGTTSTKAVLFTPTGKMIAEAEKEIQTYYPKRTYVEQDPDEIEQASIEAIQEVMKTAALQPKDLLAVGFSSAMHSLICLDEQYQPLSKAIIWADGRSDQQAEQLEEEKKQEIYKRTGTPIHPMTPFVKLLWMKETNFKPYREAAYFFSVKEYIIRKWFNTSLIDYSMAAATGLLHISTLSWDEEALKLTGVQEEQLATIVPPTTLLPPIDEKIANQMGIPKEVPCIIGAADGQLANLGSGAIQEGEVAISAGTSGAIRQMIHGVSVSPKRETFCYPFTKDHSIIGGATNNGGIAFQWIKDVLEYDGSFTDLTKEAEQVPIGAEGVLFFPYINGERAPLWNQQAKGNFFGLSITHRKEHLIRAVLEGIVFNLYQIGKSLERQAGKPEKIYVNGGLSRSTLWVQIVADVFKREVHLSETHHSSAWGAAWLALVAIGERSSLEEIQEYIPIVKTFHPRKEAMEKYAEIYKTYETIGKDLAKHFH